MINRKKTFMAVFMVLAMLAVSLVPLADSFDTDATGGTGGDLYGIGRNNYGQMEDMDTTKIFTNPTQLGSGLGTIVDIIRASNTTFFTTSDGKLYGIGDNTYGQMGNGQSGSGQKVTSPIQIGSGLGTIIKAKSNGNCVFFITSDGKLYGMGQNNYKQIQGDATSPVTSPVQIGSGLGTIVDIGDAGITTFFITSDGKLYGMGANYNGQMGQGNTNSPVTSPVQIGSDLGTITKVVNREHILFLTSDGKLYGMGENDKGQLGNGQSGSGQKVTSPIQIGSDLGTIIDFNAANGNTYFITSDGKLYGIGDNANGQMGQGNTISPVTSPVQIGSDLGTIAKVICSTKTTYFITSDGKLYGIGDNTYGQMGNGQSGSGQKVTSPIQIGSDLGTITNVKIGENTVLFLTSDGKLYGIGDNTYGQMGNGQSGSGQKVTSPIQIGSDLGTIIGYEVSYTNSAFIVESTPPAIVTITTTPSGYGTVSANSVSDVPVGTTVTVSTNTLTINTSTPTVITATPTTDTAQYDYEFSSWSISDGATIDADTTVTATFTRSVIDYTVTVQSNNTSYGTVSSASVTVPYGTSISANTNVLSVGSNTVTATSNTDTAEWDYRFVDWTGIPVGGEITANVTVTANFEAVKRNYDVTITASPTGYGTVSTNQLTVPYGTSISSASNVLTVGTDTVTATPSTATAQYTYAFGSWTGIPAGGTITGDTAITATFTGTVNNYTVTIESNNVSYGTVSPASVANVPYGTIITVSDNTMSINGTTVTATPTADTAEWDYSFVNWTVGGSAISTYTVQGATTVVGNFDRSAYEYTVSFAPNEPTYGTVSPASVANVPAGSTFTVSSNEITINGTTVTATPTDTVQYDSTFVGWFDAATGGNEITSSTTVSGNMDVYARFTVQTLAYTVTIESNNSSYGTVSPTSIADVPYGTTITVSDNTLSINGTTVTATPTASTEEVTYSFIRWQLNGTDISGTATTDEDSILTAVFGATVETYTITWVIDGVSETTTVEVGAMPTHADPVKEYYTFKGWQPRIVAVTGDATYTATFVPTQYTVTWNPNGGTVRPASSVGDVETAVTVPTPTREFYTFDGWFTAAEGGEQLVTPYMPTSNATYYAQWTVETYTISFDANGGTAVADMEGTQFTPISLPSTTYDSNNFAGWYTAATGGKLIGFANTLYYAKADTTLYAHWTTDTIFTYSLNYDVTGGYNAPPAQVATANDNVEHTFKIAGSNAKKTGLYFAGWATTSSATEAEYYAGDEIVVQGNGSVTLYAVWTDVEPDGPIDWIVGVVAVLVGIGILLGAVTSMVLVHPKTGREFATSIVAIAIAVVLYVTLLLPLLGLI